jgi:hypothetical protein
MKPRTIYLQKIADAAMIAIESHWQAGIGTRPVSLWDNRDVINDGLLRDALAEYGLESSDYNLEQIERIVSPIVFRDWYANVGHPNERLQHALGMLHVGGVNTCGLLRIKAQFSPKSEPAPAKSFTLGIRALFPLTRA